MQTYKNSAENNHTIEQLFDFASLEESKGNLENAILVYDSLIKKAPETMLAYIKLGNILIKRAYYNQAFHLFQRALRIERNSQILFKMGMLFYQKYQFAEAVNFFLECITVNPESTEANLSAGKSFSRMGQYQKSLLFFNKVLEKNHSHIIALREKLEASYKLKDYRQTQNIALRLIELNPEEYLSYRYLGFSELFLGNFQTAEKAFEKALAKNPLWSKINDKFQGKTLRHDLNFPQDKKKLLELEKNYIAREDHRSLGYLYFYNGEHQKAIEAFEKAKLRIAN